MQRKLFPAVFAVWATSAIMASSAIASDAAYYKAYLHFLLTDQVERQAELLVKNADPKTREESLVAVSEWSADQKRAIRASLMQSNIGGDAKAEFERFVARYLEAESAGDPELLRSISREFGWPGMQDYQALRQKATAELLSNEMDDASRFLGLLQTWIEQREKGISTGPLKRWLDYASRPVPSPASAQAPRSARNPLAAAEAPLGEYTSWDEPGASPLDAYSRGREEKRARVVEEARIAMQQIAEERRAAEEEYAQKKQAEAQADAEAVRRQAERMAAADQLAQEQRQKSWGNRLKKIVGSTVSAATGAFTGGIGTRAGEEAANAIFGD